MNPQERFFILLEELARFYRISGALDEVKKENAASSENWRACLEFALSDERKIKVQLEAEFIKEWNLLRILMTFEKPNVGPAWTAHREFLEALLLCRIFPGTIFPVVPILLPNDEMQWQALFPLDAEIETSKKAILAVVEGAISFYEGATELTRDLGFRKELTIHLRTFAYSSGLAWTLGEWERQKLRHANASHAMETYSPEGHYYRLLPATEKVAGIIAINLGNMTDFVGVENLLPHLLKANAITFLSDNYYVGIDDREGLLLTALLPPAEEYETKLLVTALLQRAVAVRKFFNAVTNELEAVRIQERFKKRGMSEVEELILT
ncbi:MAG: hypothetical protein NT164_04330 [Verrucomicrobiae bacterium]|nr:hypothetical protein [Verrucomicrobiae bacterium]